MEEIIIDVIKLVVVLVFTTMIFEIGKEEKTIKTHPIQFFGIAIILSIIVTISVNWMMNYFS